MTTSMSADQVTYLTVATLRLKDVQAMRLQETSLVTEAIRMLGNPVGGGSGGGPRPSVDRRGRFAY